MATAEVPASFNNNQNKQHSLTEEEERASLETLIFFQNAVRAGQHPKYGQPITNGNAVPLQDRSKKGGYAPPGANVNNGTFANKAADLTQQSNGASARPIPVFPPALSIPSKNELGGAGERTVVTINGKDSPKRQGGRKDHRDDRHQHQHHNTQGLQHQLPPNPQQWDVNQHWMMAPGQHHVQEPQRDMNFPHLPMLPVPPPPGFEMPPGFPMIPVPPPPLPGQHLPPHILQLANQAQSQPDAMAVDKALDAPKTNKSNREVGSYQTHQNYHLAKAQEGLKTVQELSNASDFQASLKRAQEIAANLPKAGNDTKPNVPTRAEANKPQKSNKSRNNSAASSPTSPAFANADRREEDRQGFQRQPPRDHRQYNDKRGAEALRKTAMNNNHNGKEERRGEKESQFIRDRERFQERDHRNPQNPENKNFKVSPILSNSNSPDSYGYDDTKDGTNLQKRRSISPAYENSQKHLAPGNGPRPGRPAETVAPTRSHEGHKTLDIDEGEDALTDSKRKANMIKDTAKPQQNHEKKPSPQLAVKREAAPPSPALSIPREPPILEPLSPRARTYMLTERYGAPAAIKQQGYFRYREPYPMMGYARSPYDPYDYPPAPPPHAREPRPISPRGAYPPPGSRGYAPEYVYQDPFHDHYYGYPPPRRPGSPPPARAPGPRYRYEDEEAARPPVRGRSTSPRAPGRVPVARPRRSSRSMSPPRERPPPRTATATNEPNDEQRQERGLIRASDAPQYADYPQYPRQMAPYDSYIDHYGRHVIVRERPVYIPRVVYVDSEGRPYRARSPAEYPQTTAQPPAHGGHPPPLPPPPPPVRRYADDPEAMSDRYYRERDYDYGPAYDRGGYPREYGREYPPHPYAHPPPPPHAREGYPRDYPMPPASREDERAFREREYGSHPHPPHPGHPVHPPPPQATAPPRDVEDPRLSYAREPRGGPPPPPVSRY